MLPSTFPSFAELYIPQAQSLGVPLFPLLKKFTSCLIEEELAVYRLVNKYEFVMVYLGGRPLCGDRDLFLRTFLAARYRRCSKRGLLILIII